MSNRRNFSSSQPLSRYSNQDSSNSTNGAPSEQFSSRSSSFGGGWGRPNSDSRPQASGGGGWGRPQHTPTAASGGWSRSSFQRSPAAVGGGWGRRPASEEASTQQPQQPQQPQLEETSEQTAPPEGYDYEFLLYAFNQKYVLPEDLSQDDLPDFDNLVIDYIARNPLRYGQKLKDAIDRALLKIHEELQTKLRKRIPEKDSHLSAPTMCQEFTLKLNEMLCSFQHTHPEDVKKFVDQYMKTPLSQHFIPGSFDKDTGNQICLRDSQAYTEQHMSHAIHTYFMTLDLRSIVRDRFGFVDNKMPIQLFRQLPSIVRNLIKSAMYDNGRVVNGFLMVYPPGNGTLKKKLLESLITPSQQSYSVHFVSLTSKGLPTTGDVCLVIPSEILTQTKSEKDASHARVITQKPVMSQYRTAGNKGTILLGMYEVLDWKMHNMQCSFNGANMKLLMKNFCTILSSNYGTIPLVVEDEPQMTVSKQLPEDTFFPIHDDTSSAGGGWGAAAP